MYACVCKKGVTIRGRGENRGDGKREGKEKCELEGRGKEGVRLKFDPLNFRLEEF